MKRYYTAKELSQVTGLTIQAVYKQFNGIYKEFINTTNGVKMLDTELLKKNNIKEFNIIFDKVNNFLETEKEESSSTTAGNDMLIETLQATIQELTNQLKVKDEQIKALNSQLTAALNISQQTNILAARDKPLIQADKQEQEQEQRQGFFSKLFK